MTQKNYMDVRVVLRLVWGNTKNIINSFCTFYKSSLKSCSFFIKRCKVSLHPKKKNLRRLIKYSRLFKIEDEIRKYMEVLSWLISRP